MDGKYSVDTIRLRVKLVENGFKSITELSKASGVRIATLSLVLAGKARPSSENMYRLVDALNINPEEVGPIFFAEKLT